MPLFARNPTRWLWLALLALVMVACRPGPDPIRPVVPTPTPGGPIVFDQPILVTFSQLEQDAAQPDSTFRNRYIRVTGSYQALQPVVCGRRPQNGPVIGWALIAENLQLQATNFATVLRLVVPDTQLTVDGVWRRYDGPIGCGKEPARGTVWYLEAHRIVAPNPLPVVAEANEVPIGGGGLPETAPGGSEGNPAEPGGNSGTAPPLATQPLVLGGSGVPTATPAGGAVPATGTAPAGIGSTPGAGTPTGGSPTATATATASRPAGTTATATARPGASATPTATNRPPGTATPRPSPTRLLTATPGPSPTSGPLVTPTPSATSMGYPGPSPTPTPGGYP